MMTSLITVKQVSEMLAIAPPTVYQWAREGYLPHVKLGGAIRFEREKVEEWVRKNRVNGRATRLPDLD